MGWGLRRRPGERNERPFEGPDRGCSPHQTTCNCAVRWEKRKTSDRTRDIRCVAKLLRDGGYSYDQSKHLIAEARRRVGLTPPQRKKGSVDRLTREELEALRRAACLLSLRPLSIGRFERSSECEARSIRKTTARVDLLAHISPISWDNVVLYGEYKPRQSWSRRETPELYRIRLHVSACYPRYGGSLGEQTAQSPVADTMRKHAAVLQKLANTLGGRAHPAIALRKGTARTLRLTAYPSPPRPGSLAEPLLWAIPPDSGPPSVFRF